MSCSQFNALFKKNFILMKRNCFSSCCQILFPVIMFMFISFIRKSLESDDIEFKGTDTEFIKNQSSIYPTYNNNSYIDVGSDSEYSIFGVRNPFYVCDEKETNIIGLVTNNTSDLTDSIKEKISNINNTIVIKEFSTIEDLFSYVTDLNYGISLKKICFGFGITKLSDKQYNISLHYFAPRDQDTEDDNFISDIPSTLYDSLSPFQTVPLTDEFDLWLKSGFITIQNLLNNVILEALYKSKINNSGSLIPRITSGILSMKYPLFTTDDFEQVLNFIVPFFLVVIYMIPLIVFVFRMVKDKETRVKEGMKMMGMSDSSYFFSYFFQYLIINFIIAFLGALILKQAFENIPVGIRFFVLFLYGLSVFGIIYISQAFIDKSTMAIIISIMIYYTSYFVSIVVIEKDDISNGALMAMSLLSPSALRIGVKTLAKFETSGITLSGDNISYKYNGYSIRDMLLMLIVDTLLYNFIGFYLENIVSHEFGISRPWYFLFTKDYWYGSGKDNDNNYLANNFNNSEINKINDINASPNHDFAKILNKNNQKSNNSFVFDNINFQDESNYTNKIKEGNYIQIRNVQKVFQDGKKALNGVNFNLYKDEIFALLGHNGAGKSTLINLISGLYKSDEGRVMYQNQNMLQNLDSFRKRIGVCPQHDVLFEDLSVKEHLELFARFKGVNTENIQKEIDKLLTDLEIKNKCDDLSQNLSGGQKRKLCIAIALIGNSEIVFLDEPTSGMDITNRRKLWDILKKFAKDRIIVLTTHYMEEASVLGKRIGVLSAGKMKCTGTPLFLINRYGKNISLTLVKHYLKHNTSDDSINQEICSFINSTFYNYSESNENEKLEFEVLTEEIIVRIPKNHDSFKLNYQKFFKELDNNLERLYLKTYSASMPTLEDVFLLLADQVKKDKLNAMNDQEKEVKVHRKYNFDSYDASQVVIPTGFAKAIYNLQLCFVKRYKQAVRNSKVFILEVFCPILLVVIGLAINSIEFVQDPPNKLMTISNYDFSQKAIIPNFSYKNRINDLANSFSPSGISITYINSINDDQDTLLNNLISFSNYVYSNFNSTQVADPLLNNTNDGSELSSFYFNQYDVENHVYEFISLINSKTSDGPPTFTQVVTNQLINNILGTNDIVINVSP